MTKSKPVAPRKEPRQERGKATVDALLKAAAYILVQQGYERATTNRIAQRAGVNIASLYQYFPNKEALVAELNRRHVEETREAAAQTLRQHQGQRAEERLRALVSAVLAAHSVSPALHRVLTERVHNKPKVASATDEALRQELERLADAFGIGAADSERVRWIVFEVVHSLVHRAAAEHTEELSSGALAEELVVLLGSYLAARAKHKPGARGLV